MSETIDVYGMTCTACADSIKKSVQNLDGVETVDVNLMMEQLTYEGDAPRTEVERAVLDAGYRPEGYEREGIVSKLRSKLGV